MVFNIELHALVHMNKMESRKKKNRHLIDTDLTLFAHANVPFWFWSYAFTTICYLINRMTSIVLNNASPFEKLFKSSLDYKSLKTF